MASIYELSQRISYLREQNKELEDEYDEYKDMISDLSNLINAHISCMNRDRNALSGAGLLPSRCVTAVIRELNAQLHSGAISSVQGAAASVAGKAANKQASILDKISKNNTDISNCNYTIAKLRREESGSTTMKA